MAKPEFSSKAQAPWYSTIRTALPTLANPSVPTSNSSTKYAHKFSNTFPYISQLLIKTIHIIIILMWWWVYVQILWLFVWRLYRIVRRGRRWRMWYGRVEWGWKDGRRNWLILRGSKWGIFVGMCYKCIIRAKRRRYWQWVRPLTKLSLNSSWLQYKNIAKYWKLNWNVSKIMVVEVADAWWLKFSCPRTNEWYLIDLFIILYVTYLRIWKF